jgi:hypothetical protein
MVKYALHVLFLNFVFNDAKVERFFLNEQNYFQKNFCNRKSDRLKRLLAKDL